MPSDRRVLHALELLRESTDRFRSTVAATLEDVRGELATSQSGRDGRLEQLKAQFGPFGAARVDLGRLASVLEVGSDLDAQSRGRLEAAYDTLQEIAGHGPELFAVQVPSGTSVDVAVAAQLAFIGRVFGAARVAAAARGRAVVIGMPDARALTHFPFAEWNSAERRIAPPLVVMALGAELNASTLAPFLDGGVKIVLLVDGPCAPVPLVRLITPHVFVMQTHDLEELQSFVAWPGPGICALMPPTGGRFVHDPAGGGTLWQRLTLRHAPDGRLGRLGDLSAAQQEEEILQLKALAARPAPATPDVTSAPATASGSDPADRLATWLLQQAHLSGVESE